MSRISVFQGSKPVTNIEKEKQSPLSLKRILIAHANAISQKLLPVLIGLPTR